MTFSLILTEIKGHQVWTLKFPYLYLQNVFSSILTLFCIRGRNVLLIFQESSHICAFNSISPVWSFLKICSVSYISFQNSVSNCVCVYLSIYLSPSCSFSCSLSLPPAFSIFLNHSVSISLSIFLPFLISLFSFLLFLLILFFQVSQQHSILDLL